MLYDDAEQLEVRHVVSLAHYNVDIYAGGEPIPEGELFIKRNCIRLTQRTSAHGLVGSKPFCLFSENCSEKEDFYHAMLQSQEYRAGNSETPPAPLKFNTTDLIRLVQQLHATEENLHTRWINALIGRIFLAMYKTEDVERFIWTKITKKIARVPKPALIDGIHIRSIDMGDLPPFITNPKLRDLNVDGDLTIEADVSYKGNFRLEISAIARIDLGSRFKAREVTLILATILKRLDGHVLLRIKPPPSNRIWVTFETAPKMELSIEPIVSTRQITYGVILRAIESRIREVVIETLVLPNWDDIPFSSTSPPSLRGGLWEDQAAKEHALGPAVLNTEDGLLTDNITMKAVGVEKEGDGASLADATPAVPGIRHRESHGSQKTDGAVDEAGEDGCISSAVDHRKPRAMRTGSFASAANPIVSADSVVVGADERKVSSDAAMSMQTTMSKTPPRSPATKATSVTPPQSVHHGNDEIHGVTPTTPGGVRSPDQISISSSPAFSSNTSTSSFSLEQGARQRVNSNLSGFSEKRAVLNQSLSSATAAAKKWISARQASNAPTSLEPLDKTAQSSRMELHPSPIPDGIRTPTDKATSDKTPTYSSKLDHHNTPIGRGQPLPPPGTPLPLPKPEKRNAWATSTLANFTRRKQVPGKEPVSVNAASSPSVPLATSSPRDIFATGSERGGSARDSPRRSSSSLGSKHVTATDAKETPPPPLPKRRQRLSVTEQPSGDQSHEELLVVAAPDQEVSLPSTPNVLDHNAQEAEKFWGSLLEKDGTIQAAHVEEGAS